MIARRDIEEYEVLKGSNILYTAGSTQPIRAE